MNRRHWPMTNCAGILSHFCCQTALSPLADKEGSFLIFAFFQKLGVERSCSFSYIDSDIYTEIMETSPLIPQRSHKSSIISIHEEEIGIPYGSTDPADHIDFDNEYLASMGYKQELRRTLSTRQVFYIGFSTMGLVPSIASTLSIGLTIGPMGLIWGWFLSGLMLLAIGTGMSELASSLPTSGGLYFWSFHFAPKTVKISLSFFIGITNSLALIGSLCSVTYGLSGQIAACLNMIFEDIINNDVMIYAVFVSCIVLQALVTCLSSKAVSSLQSLSVYVNCLLILLMVIILPIGTKLSIGTFNEPSFIFGYFSNSSDWPPVWAFLQFGLISGIWTVSSFDSCVHMSEEAHDPSTSVPIGIIGSISTGWLLGLLINIVLCSCMSTDITRLLNSSTGQPLAQIFIDSLGTHLAIIFMILIAIGQFLMGASALVAISRQLWAFARDDGLPFANYIKIVHPKLSTPINAICFSAIVAMCIGCISLIGSTAANALFSLSVLGNYISWMTPQLLRFIGSVSFVPGKFYLGPVWSPLVNLISILSQVFIIVMCCFPDYKHVTKETMNYTIAVNGLTWVTSMMYYYVYKRHSFSGPKTNLEEEEVIEVVEILEGVDITPNLGPAPPLKIYDR